MTGDIRVFRAPWEPKLWVMTAVAVAILLGVGAMLLLGGMQNLAVAPAAGIFLLIGAGLCIAGVPLLAVFAPRGYLLCPQGVVISRIAPDIVIPFADIATVEIIPAGSPALRGVIRTLGVGGAFGYYGRFWNRRLGEFRAYITRTGPVVVLRRTRGEPVLISPDDVHAFAEALQARMGTQASR